MGILLPKNKSRFETDVSEQEEKSETKSKRNTKPKK